MQMAYKFTHSVTVMEQLARDAARTPPSEEDSAFGYLDRSLTILGRSFDNHPQLMREGFLGQRGFIANQFKDVGQKCRKMAHRG